MSLADSWCSSPFRASLHPTNQVVSIFHQNQQINLDVTSPRINHLTCLLVYIPQNHLRHRNAPEAVWAHRNRKSGLRTTPKTFLNSIGWEAAGWCVSHLYRCVPYTTVHRNLWRIKQLNSKDLLYFLECNVSTHGIMMTNSLVGSKLATWAASKYDSEMKPLPGKDGKGDTITKLQ